MRRAFCLWLCLLVCALAQPVVHKCHTETVKRSDGCDIYGINNYGAEVTITLSAQLDNMRSSVPLPLTTTIPPHGRILLVSLRANDNGGSWEYSYNSHWCWGLVGVQHDDSVVYRLPYGEGEAFNIVQGYNGDFSHFEDSTYAVDFSMPDGTPIHCARDGVVADVEESYTRGGPDENLGGNYVIIKHADGTMAEYFHLKPGGAAVREGQVVRAGDLLGYSGRTGFADGPHLHFMVFRAKSGYDRESIPTLFRVEGEPEPVRLREGRAYHNPPTPVTVP